jgi:hypothetical protein
MFDLLSIVGSALIGDIIKRVIAAGMEWGRKRRKPSPDEVKQKVEDLVASAAKATPLPESLPASDQRIVIQGLAELTLPTFEQVVKYSPNTQAVVRAARGTAKKAAPKKAAKKKAAKKAARKKAAKKALKKK